MRVTLLSLMPLFTAASIISKNDRVDSRYIVVKDDTTLEKQNEEPDICNKDKIIINSLSDWEKIQTSCKIVKGALEFGERYDETELDLAPIQKVEEDLTIMNCKKLRVLKSSTLEEIGGKLSIVNITSLASVEFPSLNSIDKVEIKVLPVLSKMELGSNLAGISQYTVSDTAISNMDQLRNLKDIEFIDINNNRFLDQVNFDKIRKISHNCRLHGNAKSMELSFPELEKVGNMSVRGVSTVNLPKLKAVDSSLEFHENTFKTLEVLKLQSIEGSLGIVDNSNLRKLNFSQVANINGGLIISNNTELTKLQDFPNLKSVGGGLRFEGCFNDTYFPSLKVVRGSALINSTSEDFDCEKWISGKTNKKSIIRGGSVVCKSNKGQKTAKVDNDGKMTEKKEISTNKTDDIDRTRKWEESTKETNNSQISGAHSRTFAIGTVVALFGLSLFMSL
ncbi:Sps2p KNAG_0F00180 [Huiozyma naganishii CBS 8797]|uniref:Receptor L-domain domain-containing protein n=1 Tax=Huiozyma naganishii (strain ATCC MYA-139 / BCRC 22969 / CBS 8797 / KCTC 17520 / NBRC 10181 / NCYC 3082 / Yp74L-3) TaxID=1071383 RepID=J7R750_HUIN7|nr:hypothetical protein KNAG_0F00180 [Kazachstania naganishii CBS 8797]CCK70690.1 hypothetical protein KNAG_0F00180 [Kazachstania naganishii CBS 8797]